MELKIKVCGMREEANIQALSQLQPDLMGFIFYPASKRFVGLDFNQQMLKKIHHQIIKTGVFVNAHQNEVLEFSKLYGFKAVQLHGEESPEFCAEVKKEGFLILKAFGVNEDFNFEQLKPYEPFVDYFLFDTKVDAYGGSGKTFDWRILENYNLNKPFFLSGGLSLENLEEVKRIKNPQFYGVDLNSKFEIEPGLKNIEKLKAAFKLINN
ncbi:MAG: phosphoribosylanthranilate isomerase [Sphingobacteriales bacterium]|nr:phosphoribosylanthranilate isomerase [Sphingobacteriales bacterium]